MDDGHHQADVRWAFLEQRQDLFEAELCELALSVGGGVEDGEVVDVWGKRWGGCGQGLTGGFDDSV